MKELPKMYYHKEIKEFNNNKKISYGSNNDNKNTLSSNDIRKKINDIIDSPTFIYQTKVNILINNDIITKKIIGIYNNNLVTIDNEYIPIDSIKDIYK